MAPRDHNRANPNIPAIMKDADAAFQRAIDKVILEHQRLNLPLYIYRNGKVEAVSADVILKTDEINTLDTTTDMNFDRSTNEFYWLIELPIELEHTHDAENSIPLVRRLQSFAHLHYGESHPHVKTLNASIYQLQRLSRSNPRSTVIYEAIKEINVKAGNVSLEIYREIAKGIINMNPILITNQVNQTQSQRQAQEQKQEVTLFLNSLREELKGSQYDEIVAIFKEEKDPTQAKTKFVDKIKSFGSDVASNILANLLSNPSFWQQIQSGL